jgi:hypothetical protein
LNGQQQPSPEADLRAAILSGRSLLARLPLRSQRTFAQKKAGEVLVHRAAWQFLRCHAASMYRELTGEERAATKAVSFVPDNAG